MRPIRVTKSTRFKELSIVLVASALGATVIIGAAGLDASSQTAATAQRAGHAASAPDRVKEEADAVDQSGEEKEATVANPQASTGSCGVERWSVKTGSDADAGLIDLTSTTTTSIADLTSLPHPSSLPADGRIQPTETTQYVISATLDEFKLESDSDYHLVLDDGNGNTLIAEIPDPSCVDSSSPLLSAITSARSTFDARYTATTSFQTVDVPVTVTGIGFFDYLHGQTGVAPNGIELHAITNIQFN